MRPAQFASRPKVNVIATVVIFAVALMFVFPVYWMISTSFKQSLDILTPRPKILFSPTFENYVYLLENSEFGRYLVNSLIVSVCSTAAVCVLGFLAAYSFARYDVGGGQLTFFILSTRMFPPIAVVIPYFLIFRSLHLIDTRLGLILCYTMFNLPFAIRLLMDSSVTSGYFDSADRRLYAAQALWSENLAFPGSRRDRYLLPAIQLERIPVCVPTNSVRGNNRNCWCLGVLDSTGNTLGTDVCGCDYSRGSHVRIHPVPAEVHSERPYLWSSEGVRRGPA